MLDKIKHKQILVRILKDIYSDTSLAKYLGFKGGTMAYLFYDLPRFSVDLDFDLLDITKEAFVQDKINNILKKYGDIKQEDNKRYSIFFMVSYKIGDHNIKVDINKRDFNSGYEVKNYLGIDILCMKKDYMVAHKMVAMHERMGQASRDIFDVYYFLSKHFDIDKDTIKNRTGLDFNTFLDIIIKDLSKLKSNTILSGLGELIDDKQKFWVKNKMIEETTLFINLLKL